MRRLPASGRFAAALFAAAALIPLCLLAVPSRVFRVYDGAYVDPDVLREAAASIVSPGGRVTTDAANRRALVFATEGEHDKIQALIRELNRPPKNVRIEVEFRDRSEAEDVDFSLVGKGRIVLGDGGPDSRVLVRPRIQAARRESRDVTRQMVIVASGREGRIRVGERVPYLQWFNQMGAAWGYLDAEVEWTDVGAFLAVEPIVSGDGRRILLRLTPELSGLVDGNPYRTRFERVQTEVVVADGETVDLGGLTNENDFYDRFLVGRRGSQTTRSLDIRLTPRIVEPESGAMQPSAPDR